MLGLLSDRLTNVVNRISGWGRLADDVLLGERLNDLARLGLSGGAHLVGYSGAYATVGDALDALDALEGGNVRRVSADTTIMTTDALVLVDATSGDITLTLPDTADGPAQVTVKKIDEGGNRLILAPSGAETVEGLTAAAAALDIKTAWSVPYATRTLHAEAGVGYWIV